MVILITISGQFIVVISEIGRAQSVQCCSSMNIKGEGSGKSKPECSGVNRCELQGATNRAGSDKII